MATTTLNKWANEDEVLAAIRTEMAAVKSNSSMETARLHLETLRERLTPYADPGSKSYPYPLNKVIKKYAVAYAEAAKSHTNTAQARAAALTAIAKKTEEAQAEDAAPVELPGEQMNVLPEMEVFVPAESSKPAEYISPPFPIHAQPKVMAEAPPPASDQIDWTKLMAPFTPGELKSYKRKGKDGSTKTITYVTRPAIIKRLNQVLGPFGWQSDIKKNDGLITCGIGIKVNGEWIWKWDATGEESDEERKISQKSKTDAGKSAASYAFRRVAVMWGIGWYLVK